MHERGFAAAAGSDDRCVFALFDCEIDPIERQDLLFADAVPLGNIMQFDQSHNARQGSAVLRFWMFDVERSPFSTALGFLLPQSIRLHEQDLLAGLQAIQNLRVIDIRHADLHLPLLRRLAVPHIDDASIPITFEDG